jgi:hypothetical protein
MSGTTFVGRRGRAYYLALVIMALVVARGDSIGAITIVPTFDSTITNDPNAATIEATINSAIAIYEHIITDSITVNITYREMTTGLGENSTYYNPMPYQSYVAALANHATSTNDGIAVSHLPNSATNPVNGNGTVNVQLPNARALGINIVPPAGMPDGTISLNTSIMNLSRSATDPTKFDLMSTTMHEMDEVLGFGSALSNVGKNGDPAPSTAIWPLDLFRYDQNGARSFSTSLSTTAFFSLNGTTDLAQFNQHAGGDFSDWYSFPNGAAIPHVQDAYATRGVAPNLSVEFTGLDILGYHLVPLGGDANGDGVVNAQDLALVASGWLGKGANGVDVNHDGIVNGQDLAIISSNWLGTYGSAGTGGGTGMSGGSQVPEPSAWLLAILASCALLGTGRWRRGDRRVAA